MSDAILNMAAAMPTYITKEIVKVWRRIVKEFHTELPMLYERWKLLLIGLLFQYLHGVGSRSAHYLHQPRPILHDVGFALLPELGDGRKYWSEWIFATIFMSFVAWSFHPFVLNQKRFYTVQLWLKVLAVLGMCQFFRVVSFTATQLPGPNYHCREGSPTATLPPLKRPQDLLLLNVKQAGMFGCGDLIFSSHMTFTLTFVLTYTKYGTLRPLKLCGWLLLVAQSVLIIASRKHYSVDVVIAWYVVPLVFYFVDNYLSDWLEDSDPADRAAERTISAPTLLSRLDSKDIRSRMSPSTFSHSHNQEHTVRISGSTNSTSSSRPQGSDIEWRQRPQSNTKHSEDNDSLETDGTGVTSPV